MLAFYKRTAAAVRASFTKKQPVAKPVSGSRARPAVSTTNIEDIARLKTIITNTYAMALIDLRTNKGITGDNARTIAYAITAKNVNKTANTRINPDYVKQLILTR